MSEKGRSKKVTTLLVIATVGQKTTSFEMKLTFLYGKPAAWVVHLIPAQLTLLNVEVPT